MLRIVEVHRNPDTQNEYIVLQNHGALKIGLKGHMIANEDAICAGSHDNTFAFSDEVQIPASCYVLLITGRGTNGWHRDPDSKPVYCVFLNRQESIWTKEQGPIHLLNVVHTSLPRSEGLLVSR